MKMTGDPGLPGVLPLPQSGMRSGVTTPPGVPGDGSRSPLQTAQGVAGGPGGLGPTQWMLWMISPGRVLLKLGGGLLQVVRGEDGPTHPHEAVAVMTSTTQMTRGTFHIHEILTTTTSGLGTALSWTPDPASPDPETLGMKALGLGTRNMMGVY